MVWPDAIELAVEGVNSAPLSADQKADIFFNNAVRFFRLTIDPQAGARERK
jgi:hypothetical protein